MSLILSKKSIKWLARAFGHICGGKGAISCLVMLLIVLYISFKFPFYEKSVSIICLFLEASVRALRSFFILIEISPWICHFVRLHVFFGLVKFMLKCVDFFREPFVVWSKYHRPYYNWALLSRIFSRVHL